MISSAPKRPSILPCSVLAVIADYVPLAKLARVNRRYRKTIESRKQLFSALKWTMVSSFIFKKERMCSGFGLSRDGGRTWREVKPWVSAFSAPEHQDLLLRAEDFAELEAYWYWKSAISEDKRSILLGNEMCAYQSLDGGVSWQTWDWFRTIAREGKLVVFHAFAMAPCG